MLETGDSARSQLPSEEMQGLVLFPVFPQKSKMVQSEALLGRLSSTRRRRKRKIHRDPITLHFTLSFIYFPLLLSYLC